MNPLSIFQAQVDAFNARDVETFLSTYAVDATITNGTPNVLQGHDRMREHYTSRLADPSLRCDVLATRQFSDRWIVAHERVSDDTTTTEVIATFEIVEGLIQRSSLVLGDSVTRD